MNRRETDLLSDLVRLLRRHGSAAFTELAETLRSGRLMGDIATVLIAAAKMRSDGRGVPRPNKADFRVSLATEFEGVRREDPGRLAVLQEVQHLLEALRTMNDVRDAAKRMGVPGTVPRRRKQAVEHILHHLVGLPIADLRAVVTSLPAPDPERAGLPGWSEIILDPDVGPSRRRR